MSFSLPPRQGWRTWSAAACCTAHPVAPMGNGGWPGPDRALVTALRMSRLIRVRVRDLVTHGDCAT